MRTTGWQLVNKDAVAGSEGPSLTKLNGKYYLYTDKLHTWGGDSSRGTLVAEASSLNGKWTPKGKIATLQKNGKARANRHGTVIRITDTTAKKKLYTLWTGRPAPKGVADGLLDWLRSLFGQSVTLRYW